MSKPKSHFALGGGARAYRVITKHGKGPVRIFIEETDKDDSAGAAYAMSSATFWLLAART